MRKSQNLFTCKHIRTVLLTLDLWWWLSYWLNGVITWLQKKGQIGSPPCYRRWRVENNNNQSAYNNIYDLQEVNHDASAWLWTSIYFSHKNVYFINDCNLSWIITEYRYWGTNSWLSYQLFENKTMCLCVHLLFQLFILVCVANRLLCDITVWSLIIIFRLVSLNVYITTTLSGRL